MTKLGDDEISEKNLATIGVNIKSLKFNINVDENGIEKKKCFNINLIDTAGQEKFRAITSSYLKGYHGLLLIYDITDKNTFDNVEEWINSIQESISQDKSKPVSFLIGNKLELIKNGEKERQVTEEEARKICDKFDIIWVGELSFKEIELDELLKLFEKLILDIYKVIGIPTMKHKKKDKKCIIY